jgi:hypothetical protein
VSDAKVPPRAPEVLVRGGTTSSRHDRQRAERRLAVEKGRQQVEKQEAAVRTGPILDQHGFTQAKLHGLRLLDRGHPKLVLYYMNRDRTVAQECVSEYFHTGTDEGFIMVCPRCLERGEAHGDSQMMIMKSHRKFHLDTRKAGTVVQLRDPDGKHFHVRICGTVTCDDVIRCNSCGNFRVRIADSKVWPA